MKATVCDYFKKTREFDNIKSIEQTDFFHYILNFEDGTYEVIRYEDLEYILIRK